MKFLLIAAVVCAMASAAKLDQLGRQLQSGPLVSVLSNDIQAPVGANYRTAFSLDNGIAIDETGSEGPEGVVVVRGSYSYTSPEGELITVNYVADEFGYRAEGPSIPVQGRK